MTSRTTSLSLSDSEIRGLAAAIQAGRQPRVWFTADAVGMREGRSGRVVGLADPAEPDYLRVRPAGSDDVLAFSPTELTLTKPALPATSVKRRPRTASAHHG